MSDSKPNSSLRPAASVILVRPRDGKSGPLEFYLQRRHRKASFMSSAFVFPGGAADENEDDLRRAAVRELFEEAGVLLARAQSGDMLTASVDELASWRGQLNAKTCSFDDVLHALNAELDLDRLRYFAHWITPSVERKRFSAQFFLTLMPADQEASPDHAEMVDEAWVTPVEALARADELRLPPPQIRTFLDLREPAEAGLDALWQHAAVRAQHRHPILPRLLASAPPVILLLPWDPDYATLGKGDALDISLGHPLAVGPSRFVREDSTWKHIGAASSPSAE